jgi:hypothetical protein
MRFKWKLVSVYLEIVLILTQKRCTVYDECTIGLEIVLDAPDGTCFSPIGDEVGIGARKVHGLHGTYHRLRNHLNAPDGNPR